MIYLFYVLIVGVLAQTQCPNDCVSCSNQRNCTSCNVGFMLVSSGYCMPCPPQCQACIASSSNTPMCSKCKSPAKISSNLLCFLCNPSCATCSDSPDNCVTCQPGLTYKSVNNKGTCIADTTCNFANCISCSTDANGQKYCTKCQDGYFNLTYRCLRCNYPCTTCSLNIDDIWVNKIVPFWDATLKNVFGVSDLSKLTDLSKYINNGNFGTMNGQLKRAWTQAYFMMSVLKPNIDASGGLSNLKNSFLQFYLTIQGKKTTQIRQAVFQNFNNILNLGWTFEQFQNRIGVNASQYTTCSSCLTQRYFLNQGKMCQSCPQFCTQCTSNVTCKLCESGRYLSAGLCVRCRPECAECSQLAKNCTKCKSPLTKFNETCVFCSGACQTCSSANSTQCLTCKRPYSLYPSTSGACYRCNQDLCQTCLSTNTSLCLKCQSGSSLINGICLLCPANCSSCSKSSSNSVLCYSCQQGYTLTNGTCLACKGGCLKCSSYDNSICLSCSVGFYLEKSTGRCVICSEGCMQCDNNGVCVRFQEGYIALGWEPVRCGQGCQHCDPNQLAVCITCKTGYLLDGNTCSRCRVGCEKCTSTSSSACSRCFNNWILTIGTCVKCPQNCLTCNLANINQCLTCKSGYTLSSSACIGNGIVNCLQMNADRKTCDICNPGYALKPGGTCIRCLKSCTGTCDPDDPTICLSCSPGFEYKAGKCEKCPSGCESCYNGQCMTCFDGFVLNQTSDDVVCVQDCMFPCVSCSGQICNKCLPRYTLHQDGYCIPKTSCNPNCLYCPSGSFKNKSTGTCDSCPLMCSSCTNSTFCIQCLPGYFASQIGRCVACTAPCKDCSSQGICISCSTSYTKQVIGIKPQTYAATYSESCTPCSSDCRRCNLVSNVCTTCKPGQFLKGSSCSGNNYVKFKYELFYTYSQFLANFQINAFAKAVADKVGVDQSRVYIDSIRQGSTIIDGSISADGDGQATSIRNKLTDNLPGYTVVSYSTDTYNGDQITTTKTVQSDAPNIGLIVGATVGGAAFIVIIFVVLYLVHKRIKQKQMKQKGIVEQPNGSEKQINQNWKLHV